jgi:DNA invertase Pin-like site-specific DNA recombinase
VVGHMHRHPCMIVVAEVHRLSRRAQYSCGDASVKEWQLILGVITNSRRTSVSPPEPFQVNLYSEAFYTLL